MRRTLALALALAATPAVAQQAAPPTQPQIVAPDKVWPASAEQVDYAALQKLPDWRGIWTPMMGAGPKPRSRSSWASTRRITTRCSS